MKRRFMASLMLAAFTLLPACGTHTRGDFLPSNTESKQKGTPLTDVQRGARKDVVSVIDMFNARVNGVPVHVMPSKYALQHNICATGQPCPKKTAFPVGATSCGPCGLGLLTYHGASIQEYPKVYIDFWGWGSNDPKSAAQYMENFVSGIGGSSWLNTVTQYYSSTQGYATNWGSVYGGYWYDNGSTPPSGVSQSAVAAEAANAVSHFGYSANAAYVVALPSGHDDQLFASSDCAWHASTSSSHGTVYYVSMDYQTDSSNCATSVQGFSVVLGHEVAETITDPSVHQSWEDQDSSGNFEIGDKCAWYNITPISLSSGSFSVQPLWSNANASSGTDLNGCVLSYKFNAPAMNCTPDASGYCLSYQSQSSGTGKCTSTGQYPYHYLYDVTYKVYYLYHSATFDGKYTEDTYSYPGYSSNPDPVDCPTNTWDPAIPAQATGDNSLP